VGISDAIVEEARNGTLEQIHLSPAPPALILFGWSLGEFLISGLGTVVIGTALVFTLRLGIHLKASLLPLFLLTLVGVYGFAYLLGGLAPIFKWLGDLPGFMANMRSCLRGRDGRSSWLRGATGPPHQFPGQDRQRSIWVWGYRPSHGVSASPGNRDHWGTTEPSNHQNG